MKCVKVCQRGFIYNFECMYENRGVIVQLFCILTGTKNRDQLMTQLIVKCSIIDGEVCESVSTNERTQSHFVLFYLPHYCLY